MVMAFWGQTTAQAVQPVQESISTWGAGTMPSRGVKRIARTSQASWQLIQWISDKARH